MDIDQKFSLGYNFSEYSLLGLLKVVLVWEIVGEFCAATSVVDFSCVRLRPDNAAWLQDRCR